MKLFRIPDPWDYHEYGGYIVMAESAEAAVELVKAAHNPEDWRGDHIKFSEVKEIEGNIYVEYGCDC